MLKFEKNDWGYYEIDFYNDVQYEVKLKISESLNLVLDDIDDCYMLDDDTWKRRSSGMVYNISDHIYYDVLKEFLDKELNIFLRKEKIEKLNNK